MKNKGCVFSRLDLIVARLVGTNGNVGHVLAAPLHSFQNRLVTKNSLFLDEFFCVGSA